MPRSGVQGVANRDIKLENTLLDGSPRPLVKICDFGYSKVHCDTRKIVHDLRSCSTSELPVCSLQGTASRASDTRQPRVLWRFCRFCRSRFRRLAAGQGGDPPCDHFCGCCTLRHPGDSMRADFGERVVAPGRTLQSLLVRQQSLGCGDVCISGGAGLPSYSWLGDDVADFR